MTTEYSLEEKPVANDWRVIASRAMEAIVGLVLLAAGIIKALDPATFVKQIEAYKIVTSAGLITALAWIMIIIECALGAALIVGFQRRIVVPAALALLVVFLGALGWAWYSGATADCGCFGEWVKRTPQQALMEDLLMFGGLIAAMALNRREPTRLPMLRLAAVVVAAIVGLGITAIKSGSPTQSSDPVARLEARQPNLFNSLTISDMPVDIRYGDYLVIVMDTGCDHCQASVPAINKLYQQQRELASLIALCPNTPEEIKKFQDKFKSQFPIGRISEPDFFRLLDQGTTPRTFLLRDAKIMKFWEVDIPTEAQIKGSLS